MMRAVSLVGDWKAVCHRLF